MKTVVSFALATVVAVAVLASGLAVGAPIAHAQCVEGAISAAEDGTYSLCTGGQWIHVDRQLCVDYPTYSPNCTQTPSSSAPVVPPPVVPPPVVPPPPVPYMPAPGINAPDIGCTWVDGYTKKNGTRVRGHWRC
jgi:hypothetical protein